MINGLIIFLVVFLVVILFLASLTPKAQPVVIPMASSQEIESLARVYDQSLYDPSLVRITELRSSGSERLNQRRDCLRLESPSTLIQTCSECSLGNNPEPVQQTMLKTSSQWYLARPNTKLVIVEPTGWLDLANPTQYWYSHLIGFEEFSSRMSRSSIEAVKYQEFEQQEPF